MEKRDQDWEEEGKRERMREGTGCQGRPRMDATAPKLIVNTQPEQQPQQPLQQQSKPIPHHSQQQHGQSSTSTTRPKNHERDEKRKR